ncbi:MAG: glutathione peroxidase [Planctomycetota bacterium]
MQHAIRTGCRVGAAALTLLIAGCGSETPAQPAGGTPPPVSAASKPAATPATPATPAATPTATPAPTALSGESTMPATKPTGVLSFTVKDIDGQDVALDKYRGDVLLIVNVASLCGHTPQYAGLEALFQKYHAQGFEVLGFPANNFHQQEPGSDAQIKEFCTSKYHVSFPMFSKISVKGDDQAPLYNYLVNQQPDTKLRGDITWNFEKFLVNRKGEVIARFAPKITPETPEVVSAIEKALAEPK